ncbi:hypothetical protein C9980_25200 [Vibrio mediterranei]|uniref:DNA packaging protein n=1 Tax=Vibrio barjaei TaxID=1676683 RepID=A0ABW7ID42_9VIBR|nr:hypothetical protein [Vibrio mediterranei]PTC01998.1 hypothetical protein C9980_25200 [Vibrio mediterranei]
MTEAALAMALGVSNKTVYNAKQKGFKPEMTGDGKVDVKASIRVYVRFQSNQIRDLSAQKRSGKTGNSHSDIHSSTEGVDWKAEKDKQHAIKLKLANQQAVGELVPAEAMIELYNGPLSFCRNKLMGLPSEIQRRTEVEPELLKEIEDVVREALERLGEKGADELQEVIETILERYSHYYCAVEEEEDSGLDD